MRNSLKFYVLLAIATSSLALQNCDSEDTRPATLYLVERTHATNWWTNHYIYSSYDKLLSMTNFSYDVEYSHVRFKYVSARLDAVESFRNNERILTDIVYDQNGLRKKEVISSFLDGQLQTRTTVGFIFDDNRQIRSKTRSHESFVSGVEVVIPSETLYFWEDGNLVREVTSYNAPNGVVDEVQYRYDARLNYTNQDPAFIYAEDAEWAMSKNFVSGIIRQGQSMPVLERITNFNKEGYPVESWHSADARESATLYRYK